MKIEEMIQLLGKQALDPAVVGALKYFDLNGKITLKRGENSTYLNNYKKGISFLFKTEEYIQAKYGITLHNDAPMLTSIFFYGAKHDEFSEYTGSLHGDLKFSDSRKAVISKLGKSDEFSDDFNSEFWTIAPKIRFCVDYSDDQKSIPLAQIGIFL